MDDQAVLNVNPSPEIVEHTPMLSLEKSALVPVLPVHSAEQEVAISSKDKVLIPTVECRICQEEDDIKNLDSPCACSGSLKFAHRDCVQRWVNEKGDLTCEICHKPYKTGYDAPPLVRRDETAIDINDSDGWPLDMHNRRILAMAAAQQLQESDHDDYRETGANGAAFIRSIALILLALLLLRHALSITNGEEDDDMSSFFSIFLLRAAGFLLPCYILAWAITILQNRRQSPDDILTFRTSHGAYTLRAHQIRQGPQTRVPET